MKKEKDRYLGSLIDFSRLVKYGMIIFIGTPNLTPLSLPYLLEEILEIVRPVLSSSQM